MDESALIVIPARGGSKGVPRKNLRPLNGRPLLAYSIETARKVRRARCVVSTDDEEIALVAQRLGIEVVWRPRHLADDHATLDAVVVDLMEQYEAEGTLPSVVVTVQPTSPLVSTEDIERAIAVLESDGTIDTVISVVEDRHLRWQRREDGFVPAYEHRVNRQMLPEVYRETGAVIACRRRVLKDGTRIGTNVRVLPLPPERAIDIDTDLDFQLCEAVMRRRRIAISVIGSDEVGTGHVYRGLLLAHQLIGHDVSFVCEERDRLAIDLIGREYYPLIVAKNGERLGAILECRPHLIINDVLDTDADDIRRQRESGAIVVNFEDMGTGVRAAHLVINALYAPPEVALPHVRSGPDYFCLRDEFLSLEPRRETRERVERILLTFGGVDEGNLTCRTLAIVAPLARARGIAIDVVVGPGFRYNKALEALEKTLAYERLEIAAATRRMSEYIVRADFAITSGGRTVFELAALGVPTVVICQNDRECEHTYAHESVGVLNLGHRRTLTDDAITAAASLLMENASSRRTMRSRLLRKDLRAGRRRVISAINELLEDSTCLHPSSNSVLTPALSF